MSALPLLAEFGLPTEQDTVRLGTALAEIVAPGDVLALHGPLGAGKTTLARGLITALSQVEEDVVSPTFTLVQVYDAEIAPIWHFDLYRLSQVQDVFELGWEEALSGGISVVEWPERLGAMLPRNRLDVVLTSGTNERRAQLHGGAPWKDRIADMRHE